MAVAGSVTAIYVGDVKKTFDCFAEHCKSKYGFDPRDKQSMFNRNTMGQVRSFVTEFGAEDAVKVIDQLFACGHDGVEKGKIVGTLIFSKSYRWLANQLLIEALENEKEMANLWRKF